MKSNIRIALFVLPLLMFLACSDAYPSKGFKLSGTISNSHGQRLYLSKLDQKEVVIDTIQLEQDGAFSISTDKIKGIAFYRLKTNNSNAITFIFQEGENVTLTADFNDLGGTYNVSGSPESELLMNLNKTIHANFEEQNVLKAKFNELVAAGGTQEEIQIRTQPVQQEYDQLMEKFNNELLVFIAKNSTSLASLAAVQSLDIDTYLPAFQVLDRNLFKQYPNLSYAIDFHNQVAAKLATSIGYEAPEIVLNSPQGEPISLESLRGKVVLVDFWASWCGPCRRENPAVVAAYNKFKDKGFDIYSISLDNNVARWQAAIVQDKLAWPNHVSDLMGWRSPVAKMYGVSGIPYNVLLDKEGKILAKNLRGQQLEATLEQIFK